MASVLVTGGAGFIGSHLAEALAERGDKLRVLDDFSTGCWANLRTFGDRLEVIEGDITNPGAATAAVRDVEVVFHLAALPSVPRSIADPLETHRVCVDGTLQILLAAREAKVRRVIYAASSSAYGASAQLPRRESDPTAPLSPYAAAKLAGENYCTAFTEVYGLETVRLRYFNIFGPRQTLDSPYAAVIPRFLQALTSGQSPTIYGDGRQSRDFTFVADVVQANLLAASAAGVSGRVYNVACGKRTSLLELVSLLNTMLGTNIAPRHAEARVGDVRHSVADIQRAQEELGFRAKWDMNVGLLRCLEWRRQMGQF